ncbi:MAG: helix-turn-helix transcriptional regulator [Bacteroidales bacterium]|nr:helix-turn-helix transcriptional regulator [Bacteroidales bacterium]
MLSNLIRRLRLSSRKKGGIDVEGIMAKADALMKSKMLFLDRDLTIRQLCGEIGTNRTYLSFSLSKSGVNFNDYVNTYRKEYFYRLLCDPSNRKTILIELAEQSGFNSLKTVNRYIRNDFGFTASVLRKQIYTKNLSIAFSDSGRAKTATLS